MEYKILKIIINETHSNIFVSLVGLTGNLMAQYSAGNNEDMKGKKKKKTPLSGEQLGKKIGQDFVLLTKRKVVGIIIKGGLSQVVRGVLRGLMVYDLSFFSLEHKAGIAHNGVRLRKKRRL